MSAFIIYCLFIDTCSDFSAPVVAVTMQISPPLGLLNDDLFNLRILYSCTLLHIRRKYPDYINTFYSTAGTYTKATELVRVSCCVCEILTRYNTHNNCEISKIWINLHNSAHEEIGN